VLNVVILKELSMNAQFNRVVTTMYSY